MSEARIEFDTLKSARSLVKGGFDEKQQDALIDLVQGIKLVNVATEEDVVNIKANMATKDELLAIKHTMATKDDIRNMATKDDIRNMATKDDIRGTKDDIENLRSNMATKDDLDNLRNELRQMIETSMQLMTEKVSTMILQSQNSLLRWMIVLFVGLYAGMLATIVQIIGIK